MAFDLPTIHVTFHHELCSVDVAKVLHWVRMKMISQLNGQNSEKGGRNVLSSLQYRFSVRDLQVFFKDLSGISSQ